jgi:RimJ/RimL family protein N-acetyltransferase
VLYRFGDALPQAPDLPPGLYWEHATYELVDRVVDNTERRRVSLQALLAQGARGIIIHDGKQWAAHDFFSPPGIKLPHHLPGNVVRDAWWLFYMHTHPKWRRQGLQKACIKLKIRLIQELGGRVGETIIDADAGNIVSHRAIVRTGFEPAGVLRTLELLLPKLGTFVLHAKWSREEPHGGILL